MQFRCHDVVLGQTMHDHPLFCFAKSLRPREILTKMKEWGRISRNRVGILYGLRRTGKSVLLRQWLLAVPKEEQALAAYITVDTESLYDVKEDLNTLRNHGYRYVAIDEITICEDFIDYAAPFADKFSSSGMRIFIAGTDSLSLWLTSVGQLFDRDYILHTTFISFSEWKSLISNATLDTYIQWGGLLHLEPTTGEDIHGAPLPYTADSLRQYFTSSISNNIFNSLRNYKDGQRAGVLTPFLRSISIDDAVYGLFGCVTRQEFINTLQILSPVSEKNLLSALQSVVVHNGHRFSPDIMRKKFKPADISRTSKALWNTHEKLGDILYRLAKILRADAEKLLQVRDENGNNLTSAQFIELEKYLRRLEVFAMRPSKAFLPLSPSLEDMDNYELLNIELNTQNIIVQPALRYAQADMMLKLIQSSQLYETLSQEEKKAVTEVFLQGVFRLMQEDIILYESMQSCKTYCQMNEGDNDRVRYMTLPLKAYKAEFPGTNADPRDKEIDMIIEDARQERNFYCFEIKHSKERNPEQWKWLIDTDVLGRITRGCGRICGKIVLYRGEAARIGDIQFLPCEEYLDTLHAQGIEKTIAWLRSHMNSTLVR